MSARGGHAPLNCIWPRRSDLFATAMVRGPACAMFQAFRLFLLLVAVSQAAGIKGKPHFLCRAAIIWSVKKLVRWGGRWTKVGQNGKKSLLGLHKDADRKQLHSRSLKEETRLPPNQGWRETNPEQSWVTSLISALIISCKPEIWIWTPPLAWVFPCWWVSAGLCGCISRSFLFNRFFFAPSTLEMKPVLLYLAGVETRSQTQTLSGSYDAEQHSVHSTHGNGSYAHTKTPHCFISGHTFSLSFLYYCSD